MSNQRPLPLPSAILLQFAVSQSTLALQHIHAPVYGQYLAKESISTISLSLCLLFWAIGLLTHKNSFRLPYSIAGLMIAGTPLVSHLLRDYSATWGPVHGPVIASIPYFIAYSGLTYLAANESTTYALLYFTTFVIFRMIPVHLPIPTCSIFRLCSTVIALFPFLAKAGTLPKKRADRTVAKLVNRILYMLILAMCISSNVLMRRFEVNQCKMDTLKPNVLAHAESTTGYISVIETDSAYGKLRLLRCDHSILGGSYLEYGMDSIYGAFYMMDFVRFVERPQVVETSDLSALQIGLGIGVSAKTLIDSGVKVDVVELDPIVSKYAKEFFELPEPRLTYLDDGRKYLDNLNKTEYYDFILHDVFTGGLVPGQLFTVDALKIIKSSLKTDGVLAINFVGIVGDQATNTVISTIKTIFPNVLCFYENLAADQNEIQNLVFFATSFNSNIKFNYKQHDKNLPKGTYRAVLDEFKSQDGSLPYHVNVRPISDQFNPLKTHQVDSAYSHWKGVRAVFPTIWSDLY
ncbi:S-adenosyl-L-methionine-dependent methyltransferase [Globomyces pollinis-pini]|nr:S-adenosyl-L-methionine-dependent methyltransferase [Globomyces pollinis-pini]